MLLLRNIQFFLSNIILTLPHSKQKTPTHNTLCIKLTPFLKQKRTLQVTAEVWLKLSLFWDVDRYMDTNVLGQPVRPIF